MARIRTIKPEFPQSESMGRVSRDARLLFVQLWTICDDSGRTRAASRMLASLLFPYDDDAPALIDGWLVELEKEGCIVRYIADGATYLQVCNWLNHQKIDKPSQSKIPEFCESSRILSNPLECSLLDLRIKDQGSKDQGSKDQGVDLVAPAEQSPATAAANIVPATDRKSETDLQAACRETWDAYSSAYFDRYGTTPVRNAKVNGQVKQFVQRLGREESPLVAEFFLSHGARWYVQVGHALDAMLKDAEKLRTEWATRRKITSASATQSDKRETAVSVVADYASRLEARHG